MMSLVLLYLIMVIVRISIQDPRYGQSDRMSIPAGIIINLFVLITGLVGIVPTKTITKYRIIAYMVLCILTAIIVYSYIGLIAMPNPDSQFTMNVAFSLLYVAEAILMIFGAVASGCCDCYMGAMEYEGTYQEL